MYPEGHPQGGQVTVPPQPSEIVCPQNPLQFAFGMHQVMVAVVLDQPTFTEHDGTCPMSAPCHKGCIVLPLILWTTTLEYVIVWLGGY